jgi:hypothetical protein
MFSWARQQAGRVLLKEMSALRLKQTCAGHSGISLFDPKRKSRQQDNLIPKRALTNVFKYVMSEHLAFRLWALA